MKGVDVPPFPPSSPPHSKKQDYKDNHDKGSSARHGMAADALLCLAAKTPLFKDNDTDGHAWEEEI